MKNTFWKRERIEIMIALALFNYVFLGAEYLFDNMMAFRTDSSGVVLAQSYVLGISTIGFLLFGVFDVKLRESAKKAGSIGAGVVAAVCLWVIQSHQSYGSILAAGLILYVLLGIAGSLVHYRAACHYGMEDHLAKTVGVSYAFGLFLQFLGNNLIHNAAVEAAILAVAFWVLLFLVEKKGLEGSVMERNLYEENPIKHPYAAVVMLVFTVALMTCIFATLDNVVTLEHAGGSVDIGQWPRLILAVSGLVAGVLFDYGKSKYMNLIMYCVTLLSTVCVLVIVSGGSFLLGLIVFYLSAGFFVVFFSTGFVRLAGYMRVPQLWAGMGRAVNNLCAILIGSFSVALIQSGNSVKIMIVSLGLFVLISIAIYIYTAMRQIDVELLYEERKKGEEQDYFSTFADTYALTEREREVLKMLLVSDEEMQEIANKLYISRAMLYRYISSLNKKTETNSRIGLIQFYYTWKPQKKADSDD